MLLSAIAFLVVFSTVMLVHEAGHFWSARRAGITILEFGFGYPPRIKSLGVRNGVEYTLNAIPVGGFVRMLGEEDPTAEGSFARQSAWVRLRTLLAGSVMNLALAAVLFAVVFMLGQQHVVGRVAILDVAANSPAEAAGIQAGDIVSAVNGQDVTNSMDLITRVQGLKGQDVTLSLRRGEEGLVVSLVPRVDPPAGEGAMGVTVGMEDGYSVRTVRYPPWEAVWLGLREVGDSLGLLGSFFVQLFRGGVSPREITGPVGLFQMSGIVAQSGLVNLIQFTGFISLNLFLVNLLPIPGLDGGRIAFILLEQVRGGKRIAPQQEGLLHLLGLLVLMAFMLIVSYFDVMRIAGG